MTKNSSQQTDPRADQAEAGAGEPPGAETKGSRTQAIIGHLCLLAGVAGIILPIIPGMPFLLVAVKLLGFDHPLIRPLADRIRQYQKSRETRNDT